MPGIYLYTGNRLEILADKFANRIYLGSVGVRITRHTLYACLAADFAGIAAALVLARIFF